MMKTSEKIRQVKSILPQTLRGLMVASFIALMLLVALPTYIYVMQRQTEQLINDRGQHLRTLAHATATVVAANLSERMREVELLSQTPLYTRGELDSQEFDASLKRFQKSYPHYSWIGIVGLDGKVLHATENMLLGQSVAARPWFKHALTGQYVGDLHEATLLGSLLRDRLHEWPIRFLDFASPILDSEGKLRAVVGSHVHWRWADEVVATLKPLQADKNGIEVFIVDQTNAVIYPDQVETTQDKHAIPQLNTDAWFEFYDWGGGVSYLTSAAQVHEPLSRAESRLGWKVVVRQPRDTVLSDVIALQFTTGVVVVLSTLLFIGFAWALGRFFSRPVEQLAEVAQSIADGNESAKFIPSTQNVEIQRLSSSLERMASTLLQRKSDLENSNHDLELKVQERTAALNAANKELVELARKDVLTGLPNRLAANERLRLEFQQMKRSMQPYAVIVLDIDFFKKVNDTFGHATGDDVLRHVAALLQRALRESDFVGRVGGEEFLIVLPRTELNAAALVAEKVRAAVAAHPIDPVGTITVSIGLTMAAVGDETDELAVSRADASLYKAKQDGRNRVSVDGVSL